MCNCPLHPHNLHVHTSQVWNTHQYLYEEMVIRTGKHVVEYQVVSLHVLMHGASGELDLEACSLSLIISLL